MRLSPRPSRYEDTREKQLLRIVELENYYSSIDPCANLPYDHALNIATWSDGELDLYEGALRCDLETRGDEIYMDPPVLLYGSETPDPAPDPSLLGVVPERDPMPEPAQSSEPRTPATGITRLPDLSR